MLSMMYKEWEPIYLKIIRDFGFSKEKDEITARYLDNLLDSFKVEDTYDELMGILKGEDVFICGKGPYLHKKIESYKEDLKDGIVLAADGATSTLLEKGIKPDVIVSDLDGFVPDQVKANREGSIVVVHAHGDNIESINRWTKKFVKILGTTQSDPKKFRNLFNFGGFTDGDRAAFLAEHFGAKTLNLLAFDFERTEEPSWKREIKMKKLKWCKLLLGLIKSDVNFL